MGKYDELVGRLKRDAICLTAWSEGRGPFRTTVAGVSKVMAERVSQAAAAIATLEAELETLRPQVKVADDQWDAKCDELAAMKARGDRLAGFARHEGLCGLIGFYGECTCGLAQALTELRDQ